MPNTTTQQQAELLPATKEQNIITLKEVVGDLVVTITDDAQKELDTIKKEYDPANIPDDLTDKKNYKFVHNAIQTIKKPRIALEKNRKEIVAPLNDATKQVNGAAKPLKDEYLEIEEPWKKAKKDFDEKVELEKREAARLEEERVDKINEHLATVLATPQTLITSSSKDINNAMIRIDEDSFDYMEFEEKAKSKIAIMLTSLSKMKNEQEANEENARKVAEMEAKAEEEKKQREKEERERVEAEKIKNAEIQAKLDAQQAEIDKQKAELAEAAKKIEDEKKEREESEKRAAQEKADAEAKAKSDKEEAERKAAAEKENAERLAKEKAEAAAKKKEEERLEEEERQSRLKQVKALKTETKEWLKNLVDEQTAIQLVKEIYAGNVPNVKWM